MNTRAGLDPSGERRPGVSGRGIGLGLAGKEAEPGLPRRVFVRQIDDGERVGARRRRKIRDELLDVAARPEIVEQSFHGDGAPGETGRPAEPGGIDGDERRRQWIKFRPHAAEGWLLVE